MKRVLILAVFILLLCSLNAQKGLFDLQYGYTWDECSDILYDIGFDYIDVDESGGEVYYPFDDVPEISNIDQLVLYFDGEADKLTGWAIFYIPTKEYNPEAVVIKQLEKLHGKTTYHAEDKYYSWELGNNRYVEAGATFNSKLFYVEYGTDF